MCFCYRHLKSLKNDILDYKIEPAHHIKGNLNVLRLTFANQIVSTDNLVIKSIGKTLAQYEEEKNFELCFHSKTVLLVIIYFSSIHLLPSTNIELFTKEYLSE